MQSVMSVCTCLGVCGCIVIMECANLCLLFVMGNNRGCMYMAVTLGVGVCVIMACVLLCTSCLC